MRYATRWREGITELEQEERVWLQFIVLDPCNVTLKVGARSLSVSIKGGCGRPFVCSMALVSENGPPFFDTLLAECYYLQSGLLLNPFNRHLLDL